MRKCKDWLASYQQYILNTESPDIFHQWTGLSVISSVLRKKVRFTLGRLNIYPNTYVVLVGPPGTRKSEAIKYGQKLLRDIPDINLSFDATSPEMFIQDLEDAVKHEILTDGSTFTHCSLSIYSRELEIFLGNKMINMKMISFLTDVFDAPEEDWAYRIKTGKSNAIPSIYVSMLAATTPDSLATSLPPSAVGSGFTSRIMFIFASKRKKKIAEPLLDTATLKIKEDLIADLYIISRIIGEYQFSDSGRTFWHKWYNAYNEHDDKRRCLEPAFVYWYERKPTHVIKVAQLVAASRSDELVVTDVHLMDALKLIEGSEDVMGHAFAAVGKSIISSEVDTIMNIIEQAGKISEPALMLRVLKDLDQITFDNVLGTIVRSGKVNRHFPKNGKPVWYEWNSK